MVIQQKSLSSANDVVHRLVDVVVEFIVKTLPPSGHIVNLFVLVSSRFIESSENTINNVLFLKCKKTSTGFHLG